MVTQNNYNRHDSNRIKLTHGKKCWRLSTGNQMLNIPTKKVRVQQHPVGRDRKKPRRRTETPNIFQAETKNK